MPELMCFTQFLNMAMGNFKQKSQGSVATHLRCGGIFNGQFL